jgi:hypothetical protein
VWNDTLQVHNSHFVLRWQALPIYLSPKKVAVFSPWRGLYFLTIPFPFCDEYWGHEKGHLCLRIPALLAWFSFCLLSSQANLSDHCALCYKLEWLWVQIPMRSFNFFNWRNHFSHTVALGLTQPLMEMSTRNLHGDKGLPAHEADNLNNICEPTV